MNSSITGRNTSVLEIILISLLSFNLCVRAETERPNIVFCIADDWGYHFPGSGAGEKIPRVPTFEKIASAGMMLENAHAAAQVAQVL